MERVELMTQVRDAILVAMSQLTDPRDLLRMRDYHGFPKSRFPEVFLTEVLKQFGLKSEEVQAEVVLVDTDQRHKVHYHQDAAASVVILGVKEGFPDPRGGSAYLEDHWFTVSVGDHVEIPAGILHGFTVEPGGELWFLSVQSPPIERPDGRDDWHQHHP